MHAVYTNSALKHVGVWAGSWQQQQHDCHALKRRSPSLANTHTCLPLAERAWEISAGINNTCRSTQLTGEQLNTTQRKLRECQQMGYSDGMATREGVSLCA